MSDDTQRALQALDDLTRRLRRECPWDREQDARSIVPHTIEEAYELADAALSGDDAKLLDELGDVLFQVHFLALLLEERGEGDLAAVADHCREKLIRRHPHVFADVKVDGPEAVRRNWDAIKRTQEGGDRHGLFGELPENLPALLLAGKAQRRAAARGFDFASDEDAGDALREELAELEAAVGSEARFAELGDVLFAATALARKYDVDPELALRAATDRFRRRFTAAVQAAGEDWQSLADDRKAQLFHEARGTS